MYLKYDGLLSNYAMCKLIETATGTHYKTNKHYGFSVGLFCGTIYTEHALIGREETRNTERATEQTRKA